MSFLILTALIAPLAGAMAKGKSAVDGLVNINTASVEELTLLPGIGKSKAEAIVAFRQAHPFKATSELVEVKGIGQKMYEKIQAHLTVEGVTTLKAMVLSQPASQVLSAASAQK